MGRKIIHILAGQEALPFRGNRSGILSFAHPLERRAIFLFGGLVAVLAVLYVYFVIASIVDVAAREQLSIDATKTSAEVASLEAEYLSKTHQITELAARDRGFVSISSRSFVEKASSVSLNNPR